MSIKHSVTYLQRFLLLVLGVIAFGSLQAQTVTGTVTSSQDGSALVGATVLVKGTTTGAFTDENGKFSLNAASDATLIVSYVGYERIEVPVNGQSTVNVALASSESTLDEVVVTGYSTQRAKEVTSSITSVKAENFNQGNQNDPIGLVQGKVPGLQISRPGGDPNGAFTLRLRGLSSLGANQEPLVIIDGVPGANLQTVDPNDIQSVDVLKDGSAAAIYGARASAGVIIITTKKGLPGRATMNYSGFVAVESVAGVPSMATPAEFVQYGGPDLGSETDWIDEITDNAISQTHNLSLSGGNAQTTYRASVNYRDQEGVAINTGFQQLNARLNLQQRAINDRLTIDMNISTTNRNSQFGFNEAFRYASTYNPTAPTAQDPNSPIFTNYDGYFQQINFDYYNPLAILEQNINEGNLKRLLVTGRANFKLVDGLSVDAFYSQQRTNELFGQYYDKQSYWVGADRNGLASRTDNESFNELFEGTLKYAKTFGKASLDAVGGYAWQEITFEGFRAEGGNFLTDAFTYNNLGASKDFLDGIGSVSSYKNNSLLISFFANASLNIDDTYFLRASVRRDGSSRFGANYQWGIFPAVSGGVTLSNLFDLPAVNILKLRAGYGITGALPGESYLSLLRFSQQGSFFYDGGFVPAFGPSRNANPDLRWERKGEFNIGLDFELLDYSLFGSIDYYNRVTSDLLFNIPVPVPPNQAPNTWGNIEDAVLKNSGVEVLLGYKFKRGDFSWSPTFNFASYSILLDTTGVTGSDFTFFRGGQSFFDFSTSPGAPGLNSDPSVIVLAGQPIGSFWGLTYTGVDENGQVTYLDLDGDGIAGVDAAGNVDDEDQSVIGNGVPDFSLGLQNQFKIGNLDFSFFFRGDFGHEMVNHYRIFYESPGGSRSVDNILISDFFNPDLKSTPLFSSNYVENASYVSLDNASIGYNFPMKGSAFTNLRLYVTGQNLFYITNYSGFDPNVRWADTVDPFNPNPLAPGLDRRNTYFRTRTFTIGVNVGL
ncbi:MAG: SusC/RagA family TonB-linked outer membrane protein [Bacteroidia bacterium]|nr:SusC/RagA family TonB-linked outer membrane protein [Bacteroidia bacterium]